MESNVKNLLSRIPVEMFGFYSRGFSDFTSFIKHVIFFLFQETKWLGQNTTQQPPSPVFHLANVVCGNCNCHSLTLLW